jgi:hypothetical protein
VSGIPSLPSPPDADTRLAELRSYAAGSCGNTTVPTTTEAKFVFGACVKGESPYIEQWVLYHLFIGVDLIYLFDNEDEPTYHRMFHCNPRVKVIYFPNKPTYSTGIQIMAQRYFMEHFNGLHTWAMLPNADEFLVLRYHRDVKDYAAQYLSAKTPGISVQWLMFGHNGQVFARDEPLAVRFTRRAVALNSAYKTMFSCGHVWAHDSPHLPAYHDWVIEQNSTVLLGANPTAAHKAVDRRTKLPGTRVRLMTVP